jgi:membrane dipeptidase
MMAGFMLRLSALMLVFVAAAAPQTRTVTDEEVMRVHRAALLIDGHNDVTSKTIRGFDIARPTAEGHTDIARMQRGGIGAQFFAAYVAVNYMDTNQSAHRALAMIDTIRHDIVERNPGAFRLALTAADIEQARGAGRIAALIGIEGGHAIEEDLRLLRQFYHLGARYLSFTHTRHLSWAGSSGEVGQRGLNDFGRSVVAEMNRLGMMIDVSHISDRTLADTLAATRAPVFASHSSCRALANVPRNLTDAQIQAIARGGGVIMVNFYCEFLTGKKKTPATIDDVVAHINHIRKIAGVEAIGIGSDFDGIDCAPTGLEDVSKFPNLTRKLLEHGYSAKEIHQMYGGNFLRFMRAVEQAAASR